LYVANIEDMATIAAALTAPPRGRGPGGGGRGQAPAAGAAASAPGAQPPAGAAPAQGVAATSNAAPSPAQAPAAPGGRGRGNAAGHSPAYWLKIAAYPDGSFTIANPRNGFSKTYPPRATPRPSR
jgi:hypothetical protein